MTAQIDPRIFERTIRQHGILLEHQTRDSLVAAIKGTRDASVCDARVSKLLSYPFRSERPEIEVDAYVRAFHFRVLGTLYRDLDATKGVNDHFIDPCRLYTDFVAQCKGHPSSGFLVTRENKPEPPVVMNAVMIGHNKGTTEWVRDYRQTNCSFVDWGYFYKEPKDIRDQEAVYLQDNPGGINKFIKAVDQLNSSVAALLQVHCIESELNPDAFQIVPMIVTNCDIQVLSVNGSNVEATLGVPWAVYRNSFSLQYRHEYHPAFDYFYLVNSAHINAFHTAMMDTAALNIPEEILPKMHTAFQI